jgi:hypothetical protein
MKNFTKACFFLCSILAVARVLATENHDIHTKSFRINAYNVKAARPLSPIVKLTTNLYVVTGDTTSLADGNAEVFSSTYSDLVDGNDALKLSNTGENFGILRDGKVLIIEARQPVTSTDTIFYDMWNMKQQQYQLELVPENMNISGLSAYLEDSYLGTSTALSLASTNEILFTVNSDAGSSASNRFKVVFANTSNPLPVTFTNISVNPQPGSEVQVNWKVASENNIAQYNVERSTDGLTFSEAATITPKSNNGQAVSYNWIDANPVAGTDYYRVKSVTKSGDVAYTGIVKETVGNLVPAISVYPNPVVGGHINLSLINAPAGKYTITLLNVSGQLVYAISIGHTTGNSVEPLQLPGGLPAGLYKLEATSAGIQTYTTDIIIK